MKYFVRGIVFSPRVRPPLLYATYYAQRLKCELAYLNSIKAGGLR